MRDIQVTRFPGGVSVQPEGGILEGLPVVYDQDTLMLFDDFWGFPATADDNPWSQFADGAGGAAGAFATGASSVNVFADGTLGNASVVFIGYSIVEIEFGDPENGIPPTKLECPCSRHRSYHRLRSVRFPAAGNPSPGCGCRCRP